MRSLEALACHVRFQFASLKPCGGQKPSEVIRGPKGKSSIASVWASIRQKTKMRLIDDYSASSVNSCVSTVESPTLHTTDVISAILALWFRVAMLQDKTPRLSL